MAFVRALPEKELWIGEMRGLCLGGRRVLLVRSEEGVFAYEDRCAHLGIPLSTGSFEGSVITCAAHHYQYDARTGCGVNPRNVRLTALAVRLEGDGIFVDPEAKRG